MTVSGMLVHARPAGSLSHYDCPVAVPYRLDLTVSGLRRLSTNVVDLLTPDGQYLRALAGAREPVVARVSQVRPGALAVALEGDERDHDRALALVRRILGVDRDLTHFDRAAGRIPLGQAFVVRQRIVSARGGRSSSSSLSCTASASRFRVF